MMELIIATNAIYKAIGAAALLAAYLFMDHEDRKDRAAREKADEEARWQEICNL